MHVLGAFVFDNSLPCGGHALTLASPQRVEWAVTLFKSLHKGGSCFTSTLEDKSVDVNWEINWDLGGR